MSRILSQVPRRFVETWHKHDPVHAEKTMNLWKNIFYFVACPSLVVVAANTWIAEAEHHKHWKRQPFVDYDCLRIINNPFPWGDGKHPLLFNPKYCATKAGYEDEE